MIRKMILHSIAHWPTHYKDVLREEYRSRFMMDLTTRADNVMIRKCYSNNVGWIGIAMFWYLLQG
jgi:hypothetical protein